MPAHYFDPGLSVVSGDEVSIFKWIRGLVDLFVCIMTLAIPPRIEIFKKILPDFSGS